MTDTVREKLASEAGPVQWSDLKAHAGRNAMLLVDPVVDLLEAAVAVASDDTDKVQRWLAEESLQRPSAEQISRWDSTPDKPFVAVIVQPFVLAQRPPASQAK